MASRGYSAVTAGTLISETVARVKDSREASAIFLLVLVVGGVASDYAAAGRLGSAETALVASLLKLIVAIVTIVAGYLLIENMARNAGLLKADLARRYIGYLGQSILIALGIAGGMILLIVPGVIIAVRWTMAPPLLVARGEGAIDALGQSWHATKGHAMAIFLAALALFVPFIVVFAVAVALDEAGLPGLIVQNLATTGVSILAAGLGIATLRLIDLGLGEVEDLFA